MKEKLPVIVEDIIKKFPGVWDAYNSLGEAVGEGPLSEREIKLVKLAIAVGAQKQGAVSSHTKRALEAGLSKADLEHVALLGITTIGWPSAVAAYSWVQEKALRCKISTSKSCAPKKVPITVVKKRR